jgi:hypothetical protein
MKMRHYIPLFLTLCTPLAAGCFQEFDSRAATVDPNAALPADWDGKTLTTAIDKPIDPLYFLSDGTPGEGRSVCEATGAQAMDILGKFCSGCHTEDFNTQMGNPKFNILDVDTLKDPSMVWSITMDPVTMQPYRFLVPGQPNRSAIYARIMGGAMPKQPTDVREPRLPTPTVSDLSVLHTWITSCIGDKESLGASTPAAGTN